MKCYRKRNLRLKQLGFKSYKDYLSSDLWKSIRLQVLERDSYKCFRCCGRATQVHHRKYTIPVLEGQNLKQLVSICRVCHKWIEFSSSGLKLTTAQANKSLHSSVWKDGRDVPGICSMCHKNQSRRNSRICGPCSRLKRIQSDAKYLDAESVAASNEIFRRRKKCGMTTPIAGVSADEIEASKSVAGGWTKKTLAAWGVPWPPPKGWKGVLIANYERMTRRP